MKLWEIDEEIRTCVDFETGEIIDPDYLDKLEMIRDKKIENVALYCKELAYFADECKHEIDTITKRKKAAENAIEGMKKWLVYACNGKKFETPKCKITFRTTDATVIDNEFLIPDQYIVEKTTYSTSLSAIKEDIKKGISVAGAHLEPRTSATIK